LNKDQFSTYILQNLDLQQKESMKMSVSSRLSQSKTHFYGTGVYDKYIAIISKRAAIFNTPATMPRAGE